MTDPSLLELFRAELDIHLPALSEGLLALEKDPREPKRLEALMRAAHSIKGAAKIVGVEAAVRIAHVLEDCFVAAQQGQLTLTSDAVDVLLRGVDVLHRVGGDELLAGSELAPLLESITGVRAGRLAVAVRTPTSETAGVRLAGDLDAQEAESLRLKILDLFGRGASTIRLDFSAVRNVYAVGLGLLVRAARAARDRVPPVRLEIVHAAPPIQTLMRITRLDEALSCADEGPDA